MDLFAQALIDDETSAYDVSSWHLKAAAKASLVENHVKLRKLWRRLASAIRRRNQAVLMKKHRRSVPQAAYSDAVGVVWKTFVRKVLGDAERSRLRYFRVMLDELLIGRSDNIHLQWQVFSRALQDRESRLTLRELWISFAFLLKKRSLRTEQANFRELSARKRTEFHFKWREFARQSVRSDRIASIHRRAAAIDLLRRFFNRALVPFRASISTEAVDFVRWNPDRLVRPHLRAAYEKINHFARLWLARKATRFARAYADEILGTAIVRLCVRGD
jgi:hypothetical protein